MWTSWLNEFTDDNWYRRQILKNWTEHCCYHRIEAPGYTGQWQRENDYCAFPYKRQRNSKEKNIEENHEIGPLDFYPVKSEIDGCIR